PRLSATPYGAHVGTAGLAVLISGRSSPPSPVALLRIFTDAYAAAAVLLVLLSCAAVTMLLRAAGVRTWVRCLAAVVVAAVCVTGAFGPLYVDGFFTYVLGLG